MAMEYPFTYHSESWSSSHVLVQLIDLMEISSPCCATWCLAHQTSSTSSCSSEKAVTPCSLDTSREVSGGVSRGGVLELVDMKNIERLVINVRAALDSPFWQPRQGRENCIFRPFTMRKDVFWVSVRLSIKLLLSMILSKIILFDTFHFGTELWQCQKNCEGWLVGVWDGMKWDGSHRFWTSSHQYPTRSHSTKMPTFRMATSNTQKLSGRSA